MEIYLPFVIHQLDGIVGITEAETAFDSHAKLTWEQKDENGLFAQQIINHITGDIIKACQIAKKLSY